MDETPSSHRGKKKKKKRSCLLAESGRKKTKWSSLTGKKNSADNRSDRKSREHIRVAGPFLVPWSCEGSLLPSPLELLLPPVKVIWADRLVLPWAIFPAPQSRRPARAKGSGVGGGGGGWRTVSPGGSSWEERRLARRKLATTATTNGLVDRVLPGVCRRCRAIGRLFSFYFI